MWELMKTQSYLLKGEGNFVIISCLKEIDDYKKKHVF